MQLCNGLRLKMSQLHWECYHAGKKPLPPAIAMHSHPQTPEIVKSYLLISKAVKVNDFRKNAISAGKPDTKNGHFFLRTYIEIAIRCRAAYCPTLPNHKTCHSPPGSGGERHARKKILKISCGALYWIATAFFKGIRTLNVTNLSRNEDTKCHKR